MPKSEGGSLRLHVVLPETQRVSGAIDQSPAVAVVAPPWPKKRRRARKKGWGNSSRYKRKRAAAAATVSQRGTNWPQGFAGGVCAECGRTFISPHGTGVHRNSSECRKAKRKKQ